MLKLQPKSRIAVRGSSSPALHNAMPTHNSGLAPTLCLGENGLSGLQHSHHEDHKHTHARTPASCTHKNRRRTTLPCVKELANCRLTAQHPTPHADK